MAMNLGPRQRVELVDRISRDLAPRYTLTQLQSLMRAYGADDWQYGAASKFSYLEARLSDSDDELVIRVAEDYGLVQSSTTPTQNEAAKAWKLDGFRLFISHTSKHKKGAHELASELKKFGIVSFVAHDAIEPGREWQAQIELALKTMHALVVVVTPDVKASSWCDQEVGWAIGSDKLVIPVKAEADPYGFVGRYQAVPGAHRAKSEVAHELACIISASPQTRNHAGAVAFSLASQAPSDADEQRFWRAVAAVVDNGSVKNQYALKPIVDRIKKDAIYRPGVSDELANLLRSHNQGPLADLVMAAEIPF